MQCGGYNSHGQLGNGTMGENKTAPMTVGDPPLTLEFPCPDSCAPAAPSPQSKYSFMCAGWAHYCAIVNGTTSGSNVLCWGEPGTHNGELGFDTTATRPYAGIHTVSVDLGVDAFGTKDTAKSISCGGYFTCVILSNDTVKCSGRELGNGNLGQDSEDNIGDGSSTTFPTVSGTPVINLGNTSTVKMLATGYQHACVITTTDEVKCWGCNLNGQLGIDSVTADGTPMNPMPPGATNVVGPDTSSPPPYATHVSTGFAHTCVLLSNGDAKCWGDNSYGAAGAGNLPGKDGDSSMKFGTSQSVGGVAGEIAKLSTLDLGTSVIVTDIKAGRDVTCAIMSDGNAWC